jgi:hypothetical protein
VGLLTLAALWLREHVSIRLLVDNEVRATLNGVLPFKANIEQPIDVSIDKEMSAKVKIGSIPIVLDEKIDIPLDMTLEVPIDTDMRIDQPMDFSLHVPIDTVLTERELDLSQLTIPIDTEMYIDDTIDLDIVVPIDTDVTTTLGIKVPVKTRIPIKMKLPIHQKVHVRDQLKLGVHKLRVPLKMNVPVQVHLPLDQSFRVRGTIRAPVKQHVTVPLRKTVQANLGSELPLTVQLSGKVPASLKASLDASVTIHDSVPTRLSEIHIDAKSVKFELK